MQPERNTSRRVFLGRAGKGLMAAQFSSALVMRSLAQEIPAPPGKKLGWAIVGLGRLAMNQILPAFATCERSRVVALVSGNPEKARNLALRYGVDPKNIYNYQNYDTLRSNPEVDVIYIVLPNGMHAEYTIRGAQAGKHILSEKPMANSAKDCREMIEACRKAGRKLMVAYRLRYEPYTQALIKIARDQELGPLKVVLADAGFNIGDPSQWRLNKAMAGGGSLMDIGIYALQAARYISGEEPIEVNAMETTNRSDPRFKEVEATINFQLRFPSGVLANCTSSYDASLNRFRGVTASGWFELEPGLSYTRLRMRLRRGDALEERDYPQRDHFAAEMDQFSQCIMENRDVLTPGEEGLRDLQLMTAIYEAAKAGKTIKLT
jgi:predicted dehydrogenase